MASNNQIKPLNGFDRTIADAKFTIWMLSNVLKSRKRLGIGFKDLRKFVRNQVILSEGVRSNKYLEFNGKIFMDGFTPHFPSNSLKRMIETYAANGKKPPEEQENFICYMVVAITSRCMYRCEHCYTIHTLQKEDAVPTDK